MINFKIFQITLFLCLIACSCVPQRKLVYVQNKKQSPASETALRSEAAIKNVIHPGDELFISVSAYDQNPNVFNFSGRDYLASTDVTLLSYSVNEEGFVKLPYIENINLSGHTLDEAAILIENALQGYMSRPVVNLKFVNKKVTILGEVGTPGVYTFFDKSLNIFQSLGYANDISEFGNRRKVLVLREENNVVTKTYVDLTAEQILYSDHYLIKPNDIIYVEPLRRKKWGMNTFRFDVMFSLISTTLLIISVINSSP
jgi:polysaccharide biosynthesis/export protein